VIAGVVISVLGACAVSIDTNIILDALATPEGLARVLCRRI
jgi:hypothetical protein